MRKLVERLLQWVCAYGRYGAGAPSWHGGFEAPVPEELKAEDGV